MLLFLQLLLLFLMSSVCSAVAGTGGTEPPTPLFWSIPIAATALTRPPSSNRSQNSEIFIIGSVFLNIGTYQTEDVNKEMLKEKVSREKESCGSASRSSFFLNADPDLASKNCKKITLRRVFWRWTRLFLKFSLLEPEPIQERKWIRIHSPGSEKNCIPYWEEFS